MSKDSVMVKCVFEHFLQQLIQYFDEMLYVLILLFSIFTHPHQTHTVQSTYLSVDIFSIQTR